MIRNSEKVEEMDENSSGGREREREIMMIFSSAVSSCFVGRAILIWTSRFQRSNSFKR